MTSQQPRPYADEQPTSGSQPPPEDPSSATRLPSIQALLTKSSGDSHARLTPEHSPQARPEDYKNSLKRSKYAPPVNPNGSGPAAHQGYAAHPAQAHHQAHQPQHQLPQHMQHPQHPQHPPHQKGPGQPHPEQPLGGPPGGAHLAARQQYSSPRPADQMMPYQGSGPPAHGPSSDYNYMVYQQQQQAQAQHQGRLSVAYSHGPGQHQPPPSQQQPAAKVAPHMGPVYSNQPLPQQRPQHRQHHTSHLPSHHGQPPPQQHYYDNVPHQDDAAHHHMRMPQEGMYQYPAGPSHAGTAAQPPPGSGAKPASGPGPAGHHPNGLVYVPHVQSWQEGPAGRMGDVPQMQQHRPVPVHAQQGPPPGGMPSRFSYTAQTMVKPKRKRATPDQVSRLNDMFQQTFFPTTEQRIELARELGMTPRTVQIWFQNRRQGMKADKRREDASDVKRSDREYSVDDDELSKDQQFSGTDNYSSEDSKN
ncbi:uncharacterized protein V1510DRAFT_307267 [Dipodascopsis tothii]|uniref:uncharacterized protein n=1 Tax=Dipodascopsis tothii TaxID=44089 RepID=UPI0034CE3282